MTEVIVAAVAATIGGLTALALFPIAYERGRNDASATISRWLLHRSGQRAADTEAELLADVAADVSEKEWEDA